MNELILLKDLGMQYTSDTKKYKARFGLYRCYCGKEFKSMTNAIKRGNQKSCGCLKKDRIAQYNQDIKTTHGLSNHKLYGIWSGMLKRCTNPNAENYKYYGGRGISISDEWLKVENFINDMFPSFVDGLTLDRIDNNKGYSKENCRWATKTTQSQNTKKLIGTNKSGFRGVCFEKSSKKWKSQISVNSKKIHLGYFDNAYDGALAYDNYVALHNLEHTKNFT